MPSDPRHVALGLLVLAGRRTAASAELVASAARPARVMARAAWGIAPMAPVREAAASALAGLEASGAERERVVTGQLRRRSVAAFDAAIEAEELDLLIDHLVDSRHVGAIAGRLTEGPLADRIVDAMLAAGVIDRIAERLLRDHVLEQLVALVLTHPETPQLVAMTLEQPELERLLLQVLESPATDRIVAGVLASPGAERVVNQLLESQVVRATTDWVVESPEMQRVIETIASSPEVRNAVTSQSIGLANVVAQEVRERGVSADGAAERLARALVRRRRKGGGTPPQPAGA
jgi:hypothetical protein